MHPVKNGGITSGKGNCYDNSTVESFFKSLKAELVWRRNWQTRREVEVALFAYINGSTTHTEDTQQSAGNPQWLSNTRPLNLST